MGVITTETSPRRWETSVDRNVGCCNFMEFVVYIIPKTTGFGSSKRWFSFHKTTRIFFEGAHPSFLCLDSTFFPRFCLFRAFVCVCFALSFVSVPRFRLCLFRAFDLGVLILFLFSSFFLVLFGGCCFVCTFAYKKGLGGPVTRRLETVQASAGYQDLFWDTYFC